MNTIHQTHYRLQPDEVHSKIPNQCIYIDYSASGMPVEIQMPPALLPLIKDPLQTYNNILAHCQREAERMKVQAA